MYDELKKKVRILFACRAVLWTIAAGVTVFWIVKSFQPYLDGEEDVHSYATFMRPILYTCLIIAAACIALSFYLRHISDGYKKQIKDHEVEVRDPWEG
ncbi:MAG: hypothetical protein K6G45_12420 [Lachnospiraceae bacterium]|nr:hypothetical protein [Lachnospiraceae bacterium]